MLACEQRSLLQPQTCHTVRQRQVGAPTVWQKFTDGFLMMTSMTMFFVSMPSLRAHCKCNVQPKIRFASKYDQSVLFVMEHRVKRDVSHG